MRLTLSIWALGRGLQHHAGLLHHLPVHLRSMPRGRLRLYHVHATHSFSSRGGLHSCPHHILQAAHQIGIQDIVVYGDSKLVINQVPPELVALHCSFFQLRRLPTRNSVSDSHVSHGPESKRTIDRVTQDLLVGWWF